MPQVIPRIGAMLRGHNSVYKRQALANQAFGSGSNLKRHNSNLHAPPFVDSDIAPPSTLIVDSFVDYWRFNSNESDGCFGVSGGNKFTPIAAIGASIVAAKISNGVRMPSPAASNFFRENDASPNPIFGFASSSFTFNFWIKFDSIPTLDSAFLRKSNDIFVGTVSGYGLILTTAGKITISFANAGAASQVTSTTVLSASVFYMLSWELDRPNNTSRLRIFDSTGLLETLILTPLTYVVSNANLGFSQRVSSNIDQTFDELGIWSRLLTDTERLTLFNNYSGRTYPFS